MDSLTTYATPCSSCWPPQLLPCPLPYSTTWMCLTRPVERRPSSDGSSLPSPFLSTPPSPAPGSRRGPGGRRRDPMRGQGGSGAPAMEPSMTDSAGGGGILLSTTGSAGGGCTSPFWFLASMALILGYYGSVDLVAGPGSSRLVQRVLHTSCSHALKSRPKPQKMLPNFARERFDCSGPGQSEENGVVLYGLAGAPRLDMPAKMSEARRVVVPANSHRGWVYFLNRGSQIEINYSVKTDTELICPVNHNIASN